MTPTTTRWDTAGLCTNCGGERDRPGKRLCSACHAYQLRSKQILRDRRKALGLCVVCGKENATPQYVACPFCREKSAEVKRRHRKKVRNERPAVL